MIVWLETVSHFAGEYGIQTSTVFADKLGAVSSARERNEEQDRMQAFIAQCFDDIKDVWKQFCRVLIT